MAPLSWLKQPVAHRGLHDQKNGIVENSASAFSAAIAHGFAIETDIILSGDGEAIVFHDKTLERLTGETGRVDQRSAAELKKITLSGTGDRLQTLGEFLEQVSEQVPVLIELKSDWNSDTRLPKRVASVLASYKGHSAVMSFDPRIVRAFATEAPCHPRGIVAMRFDTAAYRSRFGYWQCFRLRHLLSTFTIRPDFIAYDVRALPAVAPLTARHLFRLPLLTWTVRTPQDREIAERWADAMIFEGFIP